MKRKDEAVATAVPDEQARMSNRSGATSTDNDKKVIAHLTKLGPIEYERRRKAAARLLGVREAALDRCVARERAQASVRKNATSALIIRSHGRKGCRGPNFWIKWFGRLDGTSLFEKGRQRYWACGQRLRTQTIYSSSRRGCGSNHRSQAAGKLRR
jgi:hypothetical protein